MTACPNSTESGLPCRYPADRCPLHAPPSPIDGHPEAPAKPTDPQALIQFVLDRIAAGDAPPLQAGRLARALRALNSIRVDALDEEEQLGEAVLRGLIMNGIRPRTPEEWDLCRLCYNEDALKDIIFFRPIGGSEAFKDDPDWVKDLMASDKDRRAAYQAHWDRQWPGHISYDE